MVESKAAGFKPERVSPDLLHDTIATAITNVVAETKNVFFKLNINY